MKKPQLIDELAHPSIFLNAEHNASNSATPDDAAKIDDKADFQEKTVSI